MKLGYAASFPSAEMFHKEHRRSRMDWHSWKLSGRATLFLSEAVPSEVGWSHYPLHVQGGGSEAHAIAGRGYTADVRGKKFDGVRMKISTFAVEAQGLEPDLTLTKNYTRGTTRVNKTRTRKRVSETSYHVTTCT